MKKEDALSKVPLFRDVSRRNIEGLAAICVERDFKAGEFLMKQGDEGIGLYIIVSGAVEVRMKAADGQHHPVASNGAGDVLGEITVIDGAPRPMDVVATEPTVSLMLASWEFMAFVKAHPMVAVEILPVLAKRFREAQAALSSGAVHSAISSSCP
ncbi:MAG: hypothetical protein A2Z99_01360 [Treponema sp. GWB1_62_6]|nr:MAG: hypothetical protein A2Y36_03100 [Treponema sp. GWA1_62_8]OHE66238.1 MAG: hypothetical protein A2Z99_01360 [Treponema sp. GWB1_62_6]HCM26168.1 hypothetical protein [Treponema sp.]